MSVLAKLIIISASIWPCEGSAFLRPHVTAGSKSLVRERVLRRLLSELSTGDDDSKLHDLVEELRPMYEALPKSSQGGLEPSTVRYALHRYFTQKHGWYMQGLDSSGGEMVAESEDVAQIFEKTWQNGHGTNLSKLAWFSSKLTDLVQREAVGNLENIYTALHLSTTSRASKKEAETAVRWYLVMYLLGDSTEGIDRASLIAAEKDIVDMYPAWRSVKLWSKDVDQAFELVQRPQLNPFGGADVTFERSVSKVREIGRRFGSFQKLECSSLKSALMDLEVSGSGRVALSEFYRVGLRGDWQFNENSEYLRSLGALDDSDASRPYVLIPNYLQSQTNCLSTSGFYSVCCSNECEGLLGHLELAIAAPSASPARIADLVAHLESDTVEAPRNLSSVQLARLGTIAGHHGGQVPLHGRLFAQWLHHAYPRECPFPHLSGSIDALSQEEWHRDMGGESPVATKEEMLRAAEESIAPHQDMEGLPWIEVEELIAPSQIRHTTTGLRFYLQASVVVAALVSSALSLVRSAQAALGDVPLCKTERCMV